jgi:hypothetical protein
VAAAAEQHRTGLAARLAEYGISDPTDDNVLKAFFDRAGLLDLFRGHDGYDFDGDRLDSAADRHQAIPLIRAARRVRDLTNGRVLTGTFVGGDGRTHPAYRVLGAHSGRLTCRDPNARCARHTGYCARKVDSASPCGRHRSRPSGSALCYVPYNATATWRCLCHRDRRSFVSAIRGSACGFCRTPASSRPAWTSSRRSGA